MPAEPEDLVVKIVKPPCWRAAASGELLGLAWGWLSCLPEKGGALRSKTTEPKS